MQRVSDGQAEENRMLEALSRQRDSGLWTVETTKGCEKDVLNSRGWNLNPGVRLPRLEALL